MHHSLSIMMNELDIKEIVIYKVYEKRIYTDNRIEGFDCNSYMFIDYDKAMNFAFNLAKKYAFDNRYMPTGYINNKDKFDVNELVKFHCYIWPDRQYECWNEYAIFVHKCLLNFNNDIINETKFRD